MASSPPKGSASYKKKDGVLSLAADMQSVSWTPAAPPGAAPSLTVEVAAIKSELPSFF